MGISARRRPSTSRPRRLAFFALLGTRGAGVAEGVRDLRLEEIALPVLREAIRHCESVSDFQSRHIPLEILEEEEHVDFIETQKDLIRKIGIARYVLLQGAPATDS